jgi:hypothetical protein
MGVYQGFDLCCFFLPLLPQSMLKSVETCCGISDFRMSGYALCMPAREQPSDTVYPTGPIPIKR